MRKYLTACLLLLLFCLAAPPLLAQTAEPPQLPPQFKAPPVAAPTAPDAPKVTIDRRKLLVQPRNKDGSIATVPFTQDPVLWMRDKQQEFYSRMSGAMRQMRMSSAGSAAGAWALVSLSFFYGVFHAAGPGHGKAVVTGWVLATERELRRGVVIALLSAMIQAATAIIVVSLMLWLVEGASAAARRATGVLETTSYAMIAAMGLYLAWTGWRSFARQASPLAISASSGAIEPKQRFELVSRPMVGTGADTGADTGHAHNFTPGQLCDCGHMHVPAAAELRGNWNWKRAVALAFAVGIRPCSGAILVLVFAYSMGIYWAGILSTLAMGIGVFITISAIAALAVYGKALAIKFAGAENPLLTAAVKWGKIITGLAIAALGTLLLLASLGSTQGLT